MAISIPRFGIPAEIVSIKRSRTDSKCFQFDLFSVRKIAITSEWGKNEAKNALFIEIKISNNLNKAYLVLEESTGNAKGNNSAAIQCHSAPPILQQTWAVFTLPVSEVIFFVSPLILGRFS